MAQTRRSLPSLHRLLIGGALAIGALAAPPAAGAATVGLWHMDETTGATMADSAGTNHGRLRRVDLGVPGFLGTAFGFRGVGSIATVASSAALNPGAAPFTATVRFLTNGAPNDDSADMMRKGLSTNAKTYWKMEVRPYDSGTRARIRCYFQGSRRNASVYSSGNIADGAWHTVQCLKQNRIVGVIVDGKLRTKAARVGSISNGAALTLGAKSRSDDAFGGLLDEAALDVYI
ncbi:MAG TPA: LamG-like jellyroll fold domain-containing protein [Solirubrobacteraceae bacterium]|nr:LamG-like jellyroll fold domain-containing protein [Solirubrobacteraceae bacterium]